MGPPAQLYHLVHHVWSIHAVAHVAARTSLTAAHWLGTSGTRAMPTRGTTRTRKQRKKAILVWLTHALWDGVRGEGERDQQPARSWT